MKILITGGSGQLGTDVTLLLKECCEVFSYSSKELDIINQSSVYNKVDHIRPDVIIHCAAYTKVDLAESDSDRAYQVNAIGTRNVAVAAEKIGAKIVYISTDYVFGGTSNIPYKEYDQTNPITVYGRSKLAGEELVKSLSTKYFILRTSWVYGKYGQNFVKTMLNLAKDRSELSVVKDQVGSPTYTVDLAKFIQRVIQTEYYGIYHVSNSGVCSWYEFAEAIFREAGFNQLKVNPVTTAEFPRPAPRPAFSAMDHMAIRINGFEVLRHWQDALKEFINEIE